MKEKILKNSTSVLSLLIIICMLAMAFVPSFVKSAQVVVTNVTNTYRGIGKAGVYTANVKGYSNLYCVRGGARLDNGMQLNDDGLSLYKVTGEVVTNSSAMQWLLDNMYLAEGTDAETQKVMKNNLKTLMRKYSTYKDANGESLLNKKLKGNGINDKWINTAVDDVVNDKLTLYAVQQYAIWNNVKNLYTYFNNAMQNSDGTYNAIPNAKAKQEHYTALYITLNELAKEAQKNGYKSPNNSNRGFDVKIEKQANFKNTISTDTKTVLSGPYKLKNNHSIFTKTFSATINSDKADKIETVDANGKAIDVSSSQSEFYIKLTYNKGFVKGTEYKVNINVALSGYRTFATLLDTVNASNQPLVTIRKEPYKTTTKTEITIKEELKGDYNLVLQKVDSTDANKKMSGVTFKVKEGNNEAKAYGPTDSEGLIKVATGKQITQEGIDEYTISEVDLGNNKEYIKIKDQITVYVTKSKNTDSYIVSKVSFEKDKDVTSKEVTLEDGSKVVVTVSLSGNTVKVVVPNKPEEKIEEFDLALRKNISEIKRDGQSINFGENRNPRLDQSSASKYLETKTAAYYHTKNQVQVKPGDMIIYTIRIYNEGTIDGYAKEVTEYLPQELEFVKDSKINKENNWTLVSSENGMTKVVTEKIKDTIITAANGAEGILEYTSSQATGNNSEPKFSKSIQLECRVKQDVEVNKVLVNIAEISKYGYNNNEGIYVEANKEKIDIDSEQNNVFTKKQNIKNIDEYYNNNVKPQYNTNNEYYKGEQDDDDFENVLVVPDVKKLDVALRKYITQVKRDGQIINIGEDRTPVIDAESVKEYVNTNTAGYHHTKNKLQLKPGDVITYNITAYNEDSRDAYAKEVSDYFSSGLEFIEDSKINKENNWVVKSSNSEMTHVTTDKLKDVLIPASNGQEGMSKYVQDNSGANKSEPEFSKTVQIELRVSKNITESKDCINVAEITNYGYVNSEGIYIEANKENVDVDSEQNNVFTEKEDIKSIKDYYENVIKPQYSETNNNYKGEQDDDDFEMIVVVPEVKQIIPGKYNIQIKKVDANDTTKVLKGAGFTVLDRNKISSKVTTGTDGIAKVASNVEIIKTEEGKTSVDNYVITEDSVPEGYTLIKDHQIIARVTTGLEGSEYKVKDVEVEIMKNKNSETTETEKEMLEKGLSKSINGNTITITIPNAPKFDFSLRKFITQINDKNVTTREPVFEIDEDGKYVYKHDKSEIVVANGNIVTFTFRVFNEGNLAGYAQEVLDDIPEGLVFLPENKLNKDNRWIMLDKYKKETDNVEEAKYIITDYLSKEQEKEQGANLIKPFNVEDYESGAIKEPDWKEVKASFKVVAKDKSEEIFENEAQISEDCDENGNPVIDVDSTPGEWIEGEDDQDIERIKVQHFDLSLRKWVTKAIVTENGTETITETGHKAEDNPEAIVKVDLKKSNIDDVKVKFEYKIRVKNENKIAGYAKEITDYIPEGLKFVKEDNPDWEEVEDGKVKTYKLKDVLLKENDTAEVSIILTWMNDEDNMGVKTNVAEISDDYNEYGAPDIDSTPNNKVKGEDDIDIAEVMLTVTTGEEPVYVILAISVLAILAGGIIAIKKFVL